MYYYTFVTMEVVVSVDIDDCLDAHWADILTGNVQGQ